MPAMLSALSAIESTAPSWSAELSLPRILACSDRNRVGDGELVARQSGSVLTLATALHDALQLGKFLHQLRG